MKIRSNYPACNIFLKFRPWFSLLDQTLIRLLLALFSTRAWPWPLSLLSLYRPFVARILQSVLRESHTFDVWSDSSSFTLDILSPWPNFSEAPYFCFLLLVIFHPLTSSPCFSVINHFFSLLYLELSPVLYWVLFSCCNISE